MKRSCDDALAEGVLRVRLSVLRLPGVLVFLALLVELLPVVMLPLLPTLLVSGVLVELRQRFFLLNRTCGFFGKNWVCGIRCRAV